MAHRSRRTGIVRPLALLALVASIRPGFGSPGSVLDIDVPMLGDEPPKAKDIKDGDASVSTQTGALEYRYPIEVPEGRLGVQPSLSLAYSSQGALLGGVAAGWSLSLPEIRRDPSQSRLAQRSTDFIPRYVSSMAGGHVLVAVSEPVAADVAQAYRAQYDASYTRFERLSTSGRWRARTSDGMTHEFGWTDHFGNGPTETWRIPITRSIDPFGNQVDYFYLPVVDKYGHRVDLVIDHIDYTSNAAQGAIQAHARVRFEYETFATHCADELPVGAKLEHDHLFLPRWTGSRRLLAIKTDVRSGTGYRLVKTIALGYDATADDCNQPRGPLRLLTSIQESAVSPPPANATTVMPAVAFSYGPLVPTLATQSSYARPGGNFGDALAAGYRDDGYGWPRLETMLLDYDGDGRVDRLRNNPLSSGCGFTWERNTGSDFASGVGQRVALPTFLWGQGSGQGQSYLEECSLAAQRSGFENQPNPTACTGASNKNYLSYRFLDVNGDGFPDLATTLNIDYRYFNPNAVPSPLPAEWNPTCAPDDGMCPDLDPDQVQGDEVCAPTERYSCDLDLGAVDADIGSSGSVPCDVLMRGPANPGQGGSPCPPNPRQPLRKCGGYVWVIYWNNGSGIDITDLARRSSVISPVPLESNAADSSLGAKRSGFASQFHAIIDLDGDGLLDAVTKEARLDENEEPIQTNMWFVFRGDGTGHFLPRANGYPYVWFAPYSSGFSVAASLFTPGVPAEQGTSRSFGWAGVMDASADGAPDLLYLRPGDLTGDAVTLFMNRGEGFRNLGAVDIYFNQPLWLDVLNYSFVDNALKPAGSNVVTQGDRRSLATPLDYDGDGRLDFYDGRFVTDLGTIYGGDGTGELMNGVSLPLGSMLRSHLEAGTGQFRQRSDLVDIDGDGVAEWVEDNGTQFVTHGELNDGRPMRLLNGIDNGAGGIVDVRYQASTRTAIDIPGTDDHVGTPSHTWVVDTMTATDAGGSQPAATTTYRYGAPVWNADQLGRYGFRGFGKTRTIRPLGAVVDSTFDYSVDWSGRLSETSSFASAPDATADRPDTIASTTWAQFDLFAASVKSFQPTTRKEWTCSTGQTRAQCQASGGALQTDATTYVAQAAEGDATGLALLYYPRHVWRKRSGGIQDGDRKVLSDHLLYSGADFYRLRINLEQVYERVAGADVLRSDTRHTWTANGSGPPGAFHQKTNARPASGVNATELRYNETGTGLVTGRKKPQQFSTSSTLRSQVGYDPVYPVLPVTTENELDHLVLTDRDLGTGAVLSTRGPNPISGGTTCNQYEEVRTEIDGFGRPLRVYLTTEDSNGACLLELAQTFTYVDSAPRKVIEDRVITFGQPDTTRVETTFDGFGRVRTRKEYRFEAGLPDRVDSFGYDVQGNLASYTTPDPSDDSTATVTYQYVHDPFDRPVHVVRPGTPSSEVTWSYNGLATTRTEVAASGPEAETTTTEDVFGRLVRVDERRNATEIATTLYTHDPLDNVKTITDPDGLVTTLDHDWRSRRTAITRGARVFRYEYDLNGNLLREIAPVPAGADPLLYTTSTLYDDLDRPWSRLPGVRALTTAQLNSFGHSATTYVYDQNPNGVGRLTSASSLVVQRSFQYDGRGNVKVDQLGFTLPTSVGVMSDSRTITRGYNALGGVISEKHGDDANAPTWTTTTYDRRGAPKELTWQQMPPVILGTATRNVAGLTKSILGGSVRQTWTYDQLGRVIDIKGTSSPSQTVRVNEQWTYYGMDDPETLLAFRGGLPQRVFTFSFDDRHQLTDADDDSSSGYTGHFEYRASGRLDRAVIASVGAPMAPPRDVNYVYATAADRDPEALTRLQSNIGAAPVIYTSDDSGNIATRDEDGTGGQPSFKFIYDGEDQQRRATAPNLDNELYYYDHSGQRVLAVSRLSGGTITKVRLWHASLEIEYAASGAVVETLAHLALGGQPVARVTNRATARRVVHNQLGHFLATFTPDGQALDASFIYGPFGEILDQSGPTDDYLRRFNGKEQDQLTDLSYFGARYFDPLSLTWTQADPLYRFAPDAAWDEPRRASLYTFDLQNPLRYVDANGLGPGSFNADPLAQRTLPQVPYGSCFGQSCMSAVYNSPEGVDENHPLVAIPNAALHVAAKFDGRVAIVVEVLDALGNDDSGDEDVDLANVDPSSLPGPPGPRVGVPGARAPREGGLNGARKEPNEVTYQLRSADGKFKTTGRVTSGGGKGGGRLSWPQQQALHTEGKVLRKTGPKTKAGDVLTMQGREPACSMCKGAMNKAAKERKIKIIYKDAKGGSHTAQ